MQAYDPFMEAVVAEDPYPVYSSLRVASPRLFKPEYNAWFMSCFEDVWSLSKESRLSVAEGITPSQLLLNSDPNTKMISQMDPPQHTRFRGQLNALFRPGAISELEDEIRQIAQRLIGAMRGNDTIDLVRDYAAPLATETACLVSGLPREDTPQFIQWVSGFFHRDPDRPGDTIVGAKSGSELYEYIFDYVRTNRSQPENTRGVARSLFEMTVDNEPLDEETLVAMLANVQIGASDTVPKGIAAAFYRLWQNPEQRAMAAADPGLAEAVFAETVRLDMPTQLQGRVCLEGFDYDGIRIEKGQRVMFLFASANRDPDEFETPDDYRINRNPKRVLNFGNGLHRCLGVHLANLEGKVAVQELLAACPDYLIDEADSFQHRTEYVKGWARLAARCQASPPASKGGNGRDSPDIDAS